MERNKKVNKYLQMKERLQKEFDNFPVFIAFNDEQLLKGMKKIGVDISELDKLCKLEHSDMMCRKDDVAELEAMIKRQSAEMKKAMDSDDEYLYDMFNYELKNHGYVETNIIADTLISVGLKQKDISNNERYKHALDKAIKNQYINMKVEEVK